MNDNLTMEEAAKAIGGAISRAYHLTHERTNKILVETRKFEEIAMEAADGFERKYSDLFVLAIKFTYTVKVLTENECLMAFHGLEDAIHWLNEQEDKLIDKTFYGYYMLGYTGDIYKNRIKIARKEAGLTQRQFAEMFGLSLDTVKSWDCERRKPDKAKEKLILEKLYQMKEQ